MKHNKSIIVLSLLLTILINIASGTGLSVPHFYKAETSNWQAQAIVQDAIDLFLITPLLLLSAIAAYRNHKTALYVWGGIISYLLYTFLIYCFAVHFNHLFVVYCLTLGLSFYSFLDFIKTLFWQSLSVHKNGWQRTKTIAVYFIITGIVFYSLWLTDILPANIHNTTPASLIAMGLLTNPVQVIDLSVFLPGIIAMGILMLRKTYWL